MEIQFIVQQRDEVSIHWALWSWSWGRPLCGRTRKKLPDAASNLWCHTVNKGFLRVWGLVGHSLVSMTIIKVANYAKEHICHPSVGLKKGTFTHGLQKASRGMAAVSPMTFSIIHCFNMTSSVQTPFPHLRLRRHWLKFVLINWAKQRLKTSHLCIWSTFPLRTAFCPNTEKIPSFSPHSFAS